MEHEPSHHIIVADSSALVSLISQTDANHDAAEQAAAYYTSDAYTIVIPGDILTETLNVLGRKVSQHVALGAGDYLLQTRPFVVTPVKPGVYRQALHRYQHQTSNKVSFADCVVMAVADDYQTRDIFGFERIFTQSGYRALEPAEPAGGDEREAA